MSDQDLPLSVGELTVPRYTEFSDADRLATQCKALVISDGKGFNEAAATLASIRALRDTLEGEKRRYLGPFTEGVARLRAWFKPAEEALAAAELSLNKEMSRYSLEDMRRRKEAEAEAEKAAKAERERLRKAADKADAKGDHARAEALSCLAAVGVQAAPVASQATSEEVSQRVVHKGRITRLEALVKAVAEGKAPLTFLQADEAAINKVIEATKGEVGYPGIEIYQDVQFRRARSKK